MFINCNNHVASINTPVVDSGAIDVALEYTSRDADVYKLPENGNIISLVKHIHVYRIDVHTHHDTVVPIHSRFHFLDMSSSHLQPKCMVDYIHVQQQFH